MTAGELLDAAAAKLRQAGSDAAAREARLLLAAISGIEVGRLLAWPETEIAAETAANFHSALLRRLAHEPLSRILGKREFWSLEFRLGPDTLDPRPDSETLIAAALDRVGARDRPLRLLDLGTGTGCLLLSLLHEFPASWGLGVDISPAAARVAQANAAALGLGPRAVFLAGDWAAAICGRFDLIIANPPYIADGEIPALMPEVRLFDPRRALDGGPDGLDAYRQILAALPRLLTPQGFAVLELGAGQANAVSAEATAVGLRPIEIRRDLGGIERALLLTHSI